MKEYLTVLFGVCIVSAIVRVVAPENATKKYIEILCSLCVVAAMIIPIVQQISSADDIDELFENIDYDTQNYEEIYNSYILEKNIDTAEQALADELEAKFGAEAGSIVVELETEQLEGEISVSFVNIILTKGSISVPPDDLMEYVKQRLGAECQIIYNITD